MFWRNAVAPVPAPAPAPPSSGWKSIPSLLYSDCFHTVSLDFSHLLQLLASFVSVLQVERNAPQNSGPCALFAYGDLLHGTRGVSSVFCLRVTK